MTNKQLQETLKELYEIDESLKDREKDLKKLLKKLFENKPDTKLNKRFVGKLKKELLELGKTEGLVRERGRLRLLSGELRLINKFTFALGGALVAILVMIPFLNEGGIKIIKVTDQLKNNTETPEKMLSDFSPRLIEREKSAFGKLESGVPGEQTNESISVAEFVDRGEGGGGGGMPLLIEGKAAGMPSLTLANYKYVYVGEVVELEQTELEVYRRIKNGDLEKYLPDTIRDLDLGSVNLSSFSGLTLENITIKQNVNLGYQIYVNLTDGRINIEQDWEKWRIPEMDECRDQDCYNKFRLTTRDLLDDTALISIANKFVLDKEIDMKNYGTPRVDSNWKRQYELMIKNGPSYVPEVVSVIYPMMIGGKEVADESGYDYGVRANVNLRHKKVSGMIGLGMSNFESSLYETEIDFGRILEIVERGGLRQRSYPYFEGEDDIVIKVGTPHITYISKWHYENNKSVELFVPALIFPLLENDALPLYRKNIVVPLVKDMLVVTEGDLPMVMPALEPALINEDSVMIDTSEDTTQPKTEEEGIVDEEATLTDPVILRDPFSLPNTE